jgi:putative ABC transport system permease protein
MKTPWFRYRDFFGSNPQRDLTDEIRFHVETETEELIAAGLTPEDARQKALLKFGDVDRFLAECGASDARRLARRRRAGLIDVLRQDSRYAVRSLLRRPAFTATAVLILAIGVGANAAVFSVVDHLFLRPPAGVRAADELRHVYVRRTRDDGVSSFQARFPFAEARIIDSAIAGRFPSTVWARRDLIVDAGHGSRRVPGAWVAPTFFPVLGVRLHAGSDFSATAPQPGEPFASAVISWAMWQRELAADPRVIGRTVKIDSQPVTIRGIAPRGFAGIDIDVTDIWLSIGGGAGSASANRWYNDWGTIAFRVLARVPAGASDDELARRIDAGVRVSTAAAKIARPHVKSRNVASHAVPGPILGARGPDGTTHEESTAAVLAGLALLLLAIATANVANLLLGRALDRQREIAVRIALGMDRLRLASQVAIESVLLAGAATVVAVATTVWAGAILRVMLFPRTEFKSGPLDLRVAALALALGIGAAIVGGIVPLSATIRLDLTGTLKRGSRDGGGRRSLSRATLVGIQGALSVVLLVGTGLLGRSLHNIRAIDLGVDVERLISVTFGDRASESRVKDVTELARSLPGVSGVALTAMMPFWDQLGARVLLTREGDTVRTVDRGSGYVPAGPGYLRVMGTNVVRGRDFTPEDRAGAVPVTIVSEELARRVWPGRNPLGECLRIDRQESACYSVVGVAEDAHAFQVVEEPKPIFYIPLEQPPDPTAEESRLRVLVVRTSGATAAITARLRAELRDTATALRDRSVIATADVLRPQYRRWEIGAKLFAAFATLAVLLAGLGLYGVLSYVVSQRQREMGIRLALGADRRRVMALVVREGARQIAVGAVLGVVAALMLAPRISGLLYRVSPRDPFAVGAAVVVLVVAALLAAMIPARRAMAVDPVSAMRDD